MQPCLCKRNKSPGLQLATISTKPPRRLSCNIPNQLLAVCLFRQDVTVPGKRVLVSFGKTREPPSSRGQYTAFLLWRLAGFSALAWDHCRLKSDQWQCEGQGVNLNLSLSPEVRFLEAGWDGVVGGCCVIGSGGIGRVWSLPLLFNTYCSRNLRSVSAQAGPVAQFNLRPSVCKPCLLQPSVLTLW